VFDDGSRLSLTSDMATMRDQLENLERGSFNGLQRYLTDKYGPLREGELDRARRWGEELARAVAA
jgi:hypothetical protein